MKKLIKVLLLTMLGAILFWLGAIFLIFEVPSVTGEIERYSIKAMGLLWIIGGIYIMYQFERILKT